jgi:hypothetical protein
MNPLKPQSLSRCFFLVNAQERFSWVQNLLNRHYLKHAFAKPGEALEVEDPQDWVTGLRILDFNSSDAALSFSKTVYDFRGGVEMVVEMPNRADEFVYDKRLIKQMKAVEDARLVKNAAPHGKATLKA